MRSIGVLDRTKEPGSIGEPLYLDVVAALTEAVADGERSMPRVCGGRYGLSSKEFTPAMVAGVFAELSNDRPRRRFTIGIDDDVSDSSLPYDPSFDIEAADTVRAVFFGLGSDGTVGANKNTIKILGSETRSARPGLFRLRLQEVGLADGVAPALRPAPDPRRLSGVHMPASSAATSSACWIRSDVLGRAAPGATLLLNCRYSPDVVWDALSRPVQKQILAKNLEVYTIDAGRLARQAGLAGRTNTILQTCFFAISGVLPPDQAIARIKESIAKTYGKRGADVVARNQAVVDSTLEALHRIKMPDQVTATRELPPLVPADAPEFVRSVTAEMMAGRGDALPVSALPVDGTYPAGTAAYEKRNVSDLVAMWDADNCIQCGNCSFVCPHSVIRSKYYDGDQLTGAPDGFHSAPLDAAGLPDTRYTLQVYVEDCTGCGLCVEACPVVVPVASPGQPAESSKAINLGAREPHRRCRARERLLLRDAPADRPFAGGLRDGARHAVPRAALRVLRCLRGMRRNSLREAAFPAVR